MGLRTSTRLIAALCLWCTAPAGAADPPPAPTAELVKQLQTTGREGIAQRKACRLADAVAAYERLLAQERAAYGPEGEPLTVSLHPLASISERKAALVFVDAAEPLDAHTSPAGTSSVERR